MKRRGFRLSAIRAMTVMMVGCLALTLALTLTGGPVSAARATTQAPAGQYARQLPRLVTSPIGRGSGPRANFPFQTVTSSDGRIIVHYYGQPSDFGTETIALAQRRLQSPIQATLGFTLLRPVNIYAFTSRKDFLAGAPVRDAEETAALTDPATSSIYIVMIGSPDDTTIDTLTHELTHAVFHQNEDSDKFQEDYFRFYPNWLDEGLAAYDEVLHSARYDLPLDQAVKQRQTFDILKDFVWDYPKNVDTNVLAYAESQSFISYLFATYGSDHFHRFLTGLRDGDLALSAEQAFGAALPTLEARWQSATNLPVTGPLAGYVPYLPPVTAYHPQAPSATALRRAPDGASWPAQATGWIAFVAVLIALGLTFLLGQWQRERRTRRSGTRGVLIALPIGAPATALASEQTTPHDPPASRGLPPPPPGYEAAETLYPTLPALAAPTQPAPIPSAFAPDELRQPAGIPWRMRSHTRWFDLPALVAPLLIAVIAGATRVLLDPLHAWRDGYLAAGVAGALAFLLVAILVVRSLRTSGLPAYRAAAVLAAALIAGGGLVGAAPAGHAQAARYEDAGAYTLALRLYAESGEGHAQMVADLTRTHTEWAAVAASLQDYPTATTQLRAAIALDPAHEADARSWLLRDTQAWAEALFSNGRFDEASTALTAEVSDASCDGVCRATLHQERAKVYLAQGDAASVRGDTATATKAYQTVISGYGDTEYAATAKSALTELQARQALTSALAAGANGDAAGMDQQLGALAQTYPGTAAAAIATQTAQPVSGFIQDASGAATQGDTAYFLAFSSSGDARSFAYDFVTDTTAFKVATTLGPGGSFTTRLPAGYWYVVCWDDPSQAGNDDFNVPQSGTTAAFTVGALQPTAVGVILGY